MRWLGHSGKNLRRPIAGKPLVVDHRGTVAKGRSKCEHELRVVVSTDDAELADIASRVAGASAVHCPAHLAEDTTANERSSALTPSSSTPKTVVEAAAGNHLGAFARYVRSAKVENGK